MKFSDLLGMYLSVCSGRGTTPGWILAYACVTWGEYFRKA